MLVLCMRLLEAVRTQAPIVLPVASGSQQPVAPPMEVFQNASDVGHDNSRVVN